MVSFEHEGTRNFIVRAFPTAGGNPTLLVNTIGAYSGSRPLAGNTTLAFDIQADGPWTMTIAPIGAGGDGPFSGRGDAVSNLFRAFRAGPWQFTHTGARNFVVRLQCDGGAALIQNTIGAVDASGIVRPSGSACFWEVQADGEWSLRPR